MPQKNMITDVHYEITSFSTNHCIHWKQNGFRYHIWLLKGVLDRTRPIYKSSNDRIINSLRRRLDGSAEVNRKMLDAVLEIVARDQLKEKALADFEAERQAAEKADRELAAKLETARNIVANMKFILTGNATSFTLTRDDMEALLTVIPHDL